MDASPSWRIWGHWALNGDVTSYNGSAGGNNTYTDGLGWGNVDFSWTVPAGEVALVIEARLYSTPSISQDHTDYFMDDFTVTVPDTASVTFAPEPGTLALLGFGAWALIRRRR